MPFLREIHPAKGIRAGLWNITETPEDLLSGLRLDVEETARFANIRNLHRQRHWLACRAALARLTDPPPVMKYSPHGKPYLAGNGVEISLSHAGDFAAAAIRDDGPVGIDIEKITARIEKVRERFLQPGELDRIAAEHRLEQLYVYWGAKEALYKLYGEPGIDLQNDIYIHPFDYLCHTIQFGKAAVNASGTRSEHIIRWEESEGYMLVMAW